MIQYVWVSTTHGNVRDVESGEVTDTLDEKGGFSLDNATKETSVVAQKEKRPVMLFAPLITALAICLNMVIVGSGVRKS